MRFKAALVAALAVLSGCATTGSDVTPIVGGGNGVKQPAKGAVASTIISQMDGGLIGGSIGSGLTDGDRRMALEAEYRALEYTPAGQPVKWQGSNSGHSGEVVAAQPYRVGSQDCRQYTQSVSLDGQNRSAKGTACRNADGSWTPLT